MAWAGLPLHVVHCSGCLTLNVACTMCIRCVGCIASQSCIYILVQNGTKYYLIAVERKCMVCDICFLAFWLAVCTHIVAVCRGCTVDVTTD